MLALLCGGQGTLSDKIFDLVADQPAAEPVFAAATARLGQDPREACQDARHGRTVRQPHQPDPDRHIRAGDPRLHCRPADRADRRHRLQRRRDGGLEYCRNMDGRRSLAVDGCSRAADGQCGRTGRPPRLCSRPRSDRARIPARNISLRDRDHGTPIVSSWSEAPSRTSSISARRQFDTAPCAAVFSQ